MVRRRDRDLERIGERRQHTVGDVLVHDQRPVVQHDELELVAWHARRLGARDGIPLAWTRHSVDARDLLQRMVWVERTGEVMRAAREVEPSLPGKLLVERLVAPQEAHCY